MPQELYTIYKVNGVDYVAVELSDHMPKSGPGDSIYTWSSVLGGSKGIYALKHAHYTALIDVVDELSSILDDYGAPIIITSGYRKEDSDSDHSKGRAVDLYVQDHSERRRLWDLIYSGNYKWRQLIWEDQLNQSKTVYQGNYPDYPGIIHFSYAANDNKKQVLYTKGNGNKAKGWPATSFPGTYTTGDIAAPEGGANSQDGTMEGDELNQEKNDDLIRANSLVGKYAETLEQVDVALQNLEKGEVDATWGSKLDGEKFNWISLKQYLLYLASRYTPQSLYPFIELIPANSEAIENKDWDRDGEVIVDAQGQVITKGEETDVNKKFEQASILRAKTQSGIDASNKAGQTADLWSLDPFHEAYAEMGVYSNSGAEVYNRRNVGVRVYGQLVLNPEHGDNTPSKPGAIGFTELDISAGAQCDNGIALITMKLVDVQGNKFTDLSSPWAFIYDARPGGIGGDFYFRFGWQIRVPDPNDKSDLAAVGFWNHQGWLLFSDNVRDFLKRQISPAKPYITLTQAINKTLSAERSSVKEQLYALFDEGTEIIDNGNNTITVSRTNLNPQNYLKLSILNPELEVDNNGAITATLNFRTVGAMAATLPLSYAANTKRGAVLSEGVMRLGDLIILVMTDMSQFELKSIADPNLKQIQADCIGSYLKGLAIPEDRNGKRIDRDFTNLVTIVGLTENVGQIHPDDIYLKINDDLISQIQNATDKESVQLIGWMRDVLQANGAELNSVATGSGAGINSSWVITIGTDFDQKMWNPIERPNLTEASQYEDAIQLMINESDVYSFRFQGTLVENIKVEKTDAPNALKIGTDYAIADFLSVMDAQDKDNPLGLNKPTTIADRRRNLNILFAQLQNTTVHCICHPWMGPGRNYFIKGMGFWDGEYKALKVNHKLTADGKFTSEIGGARMIVPSEKENKEELEANAAINGNTNMTEQVDTKNPTTSNIIKNTDSGESNTVQTTNPNTEQDLRVEFNNKIKQTKTNIKSITWESAFDPAYYTKNYNQVVLTKATLLNYCKLLFEAHGTLNDDEVIVYKVYKNIKNITTASYMAELFWETYASPGAVRENSLLEYLKSFLNDNEFNVIVKILNSHLISDPETPTPSTAQDFKTQFDNKVKQVKTNAASITTNVENKLETPISKAVAKAVEIKNKLEQINTKYTSYTDTAKLITTNKQELNNAVSSVKTNLKIDEKVDKTNTATNKISTDAIKTAEMQLKTTNTIISFLEKQLVAVNKTQTEIQTIYNPILKAKTSFEAEYKEYLELPVVSKKVKTINDKLSFTEKILTDITSLKKDFESYLKQTKDSVKICESVLSSAKENIGTSSAGTSSTGTSSAGTSSTKTIGMQYTYAGYTVENTIIVKTENNGGLPSFENKYSIITFTIASAIKDRKSTMDLFGDYINGISYPKTGTEIDPSKLILKS